MMKKAYEKPRMTVVKLKPMKLICASKLESVNVNANSVMEENEDFE